MALRQGGGRGSDEGAEQHLCRALVDELRARHRWIDACDFVKGGEDPGRPAHVMAHLREERRGLADGVPFQFRECVPERVLEVLDLRVGEVRAGRHGRGDPSLARLDVGDRHGIRRAAAPLARCRAAHGEVASRVDAEERVNEDGEVAGDHREAVARPRAVPALGAHAVAHEQLAGAPVVARGQEPHALELLRLEEPGLFVWSPASRAGRFPHARTPFLPAAAQSQ